VLHNGNAPFLAEVGAFLEDFALEVVRELEVAHGRPASRHGYSGSSSAGTVDIDLDFDDMSAEME
jgi:hypothetical protein